MKNISINFEKDLIISKLYKKKIQKILIINISDL